MSRNITLHCQLHSENMKHVFISCHFFKRFPSRYIFVIRGKKCPNPAIPSWSWHLAHVPRDNISDKLIWEWWKPCDVVGQHQHSAVAAMPACYFTTTFLQQLHCYRKDSLTSTTGDPAATRASFWNSALRLSSQVRVRSNINITASLLQC